MRVFGVRTARLSFRGPLAAGSCVRDAAGSSRAAPDPSPGGRGERRNRRGAVMTTLATAVFVLVGCSGGKDNSAPAAGSAPAVDSATAGSPTTAPQKAGAAVRLAKTDKGWQLMRNGSPYFIKGAGGDGSCELLAKLGGNSIRTWGAE